MVSFQLVAVRQGFFPGSPGKPQGPGQSTSPRHGPALKGNSADAAGLSQGLTGLSGASPRGRGRRTTRTCLLYPVPPLLSLPRRAADVWTAEAQG